MSTTPRNRGGPLVSVIMPCRNGMSFMGPAVERVLAQDASLELLFGNVGFYRRKPAAVEQTSSRWLSAALPGSVDTSQTPLYLYML